MGLKEGIFRKPDVEPGDASGYQKMIRETLGPIEHDRLSRTVAAPTVEQLVGNAVEMQKRSEDPVMVVRDRSYDRFDSGLPRQAHNEAQAYLVEYSEAEVLQDLHRKALELKSLFETYGGEEFRPSAELAGRMASELRFIGSEEYSNGIEVMVSSLAERLSASSEPLFVLVRPGRSSAQIFESVSEIMSKRDPDLADRLLPVDPPAVIDPAVVARLNQGGVAFIDDWAVSGSQMKLAMNSLQLDGVSPDALSINLICASDKQIQEGVYGVDVDAAYSYPHATKDESSNSDTVTLTGSRSDNDFGFQTTLERLYRNLDNMITQDRDRVPQEYRHLSEPLLTLVARIYRESNVPAHTDPEVAEAYHRRCLEHTRFIEEQLERGRQALAL